MFAESKIVTVSLAATWLRCSVTVCAVPVQPARMEFGSIASLNV